MGFNQLGSGQDLSYDAFYYSTEDGLPHRRVNCVLEHSNGFLYVGTAAGLCRFDGYKFVTIPLKPKKEFMYGPFGPSIQHLVELEDGQIIIEYGVHYPLDSGFADVLSPSTLELNSVYRTIRDENYFTYHFKPDRKTIFISRVKHDFPLPDFYADEFQNRINVDRDDSESRATLVLANKDELDLSDCWPRPSVEVNVFGKDYSKLIYLVTHSGLIKLSIYKSPFRTYLNYDIGEWDYKMKCRSIFDLKNNHILISSENSNLLFLDKSSNSITKPIFLDESSEKEIDTKDVRGVSVIDDSTVVITTFYGDLFMLNLNANTARQFLDGYYLIFHSILLRNGQVLCVGFREGDREISIMTFNIEKGEMTEYDFGPAFPDTDQLRNGFLLEMQNGQVLCGLSKGLFVLDLETESIICSYHGLNDVRDSIGQSPPQYHIMASSTVFALHEAIDSTIWVGLYNGGVCQLNMFEQTATNYSVQDGLPDNTVCGIIPDDHGFWFSTFNGLSFFDRRTKMFRNYFREHGLSHNEFNRFSFAKGSEGENYFGTMNGFISFNPQNVWNDDQEAELMISEIFHYESDGKTPIRITHGLDSVKVLTIPSKNRNCQIRVTLSDFKKVEANSYLYSLEREIFLQDEGNVRWEYNGMSPVIQFNYLAAGDYKLRIKGISSSGKESNERVILLRVQKFWYESMWFYLLVGVVLSVAAYVYHRLRLAQAMKIERLRTRLSSDLHDDVGSMLSGVAYQMELLEYSVDEKHQSLVKQIASTSRKAMSSMRDVVWAIDSRNSTILDIKERMREFAEETLNPLNIGHEFIIVGLPKSKIVSSEIRHNLLLIFKELVSNTVKHSKATGIKVNFSNEGQGLTFYYRDNGIGINEMSNMTTGQGLRNMRLRANKIGAKIDVHKGEGFELRLVMNNL